jgi:hypothetical protein
VLDYRDANEDGLRRRGPGRKGADWPDRRLKDKMGMKKRDSSGSKKGGGRDRRTTSCTAAQRRVRKNPGRFSRMWNDVLTPEQWTAWRRLAASLPRRVRKGRSHRLKGHEVFKGINSVLECLGREPRTDPPALPKFGWNPGVGLQITGTGDGIALKLSVSGTPTEEIMVYGSPPQNAGRERCRDYRYLGLLPAPDEGVSDITRQYLKKFGVPRDNSRVFIRTWQQVDGWEAQGQMQLTDALVPTRRGRAGGQRGGRAGGKKE